MEGGDKEWLIDSAADTKRQSEMWWALDHFPAEISMLASTLNLHTDVVLVMRPHPACPRGGGGGVCAAPAHIQFQLDTSHHFLINPSAVRSHGGRTEEKELPSLLHSGVICSELLIQLKSGSWLPCEGRWFIVSHKESHGSAAERQGRLTCKNLKEMTCWWCFGGSLIMAALVLFCTDWKSYMDLWIPSMCYIVVQQLIVIVKTCVLQDSGWLKG